MILQKVRGGTIDMSVSGAMTGKKVGSVTLNKQDFEELYAKSRVDPGACDEWVGKMLTRFAIEL